MMRPLALLLLAALRGGGGAATEYTTTACLSSRVSFHPVDMAGETRSLEDSRSDCQARCAETQGCAHFSYWGDGGCHLQDATAEERLDVFAVAAGPPRCIELLDPDESTDGENETYVTVPACEGPSDCSTNSCIFVDFMKPVQNCPVPGRCVCAPELTAISCESKANCRPEVEACYSLDTMEPVRFCEVADGCVCATAQDVYAQACGSSDDCLVDGDHCLNVSTRETVTACGDDGRCVCADPMINFPCVFPEWRERGCGTFEMVDSVCNGGLLPDVAEVCPDSNGCKVLVPDFAQGGSCRGYCEKQGLQCRGAWNVAEPSCEWYPEATTCDEHWVRGSSKVCECTGLAQSRSRYPTPNSKIDACWHLLNEYEACVRQRPDLWEYLPKPEIRENIERERRAKCVPVPKDKVDRLGIVTCQK